jgi:nucleotide-binding universal stress UspA family protein
MTAVASRAGIWIKNVLFLTDFSGPSEAALPFVASIARGHQARVYTLHVLTPAPYIYTPTELTAAAIEAEEEAARASIQRVESQLAGVWNESIVECGIEVWMAVQQAIKDHNIDLIVLGTHGRTGADKFLLGSVAEEIFRRSPVPVLTIGPGVRSSAHTGGHFHRVLFASDFTPAALAAGPYAVSFAKDNNAQLVIMHVMRLPRNSNGNNKRQFELSVAEAIHQLYEVVPQDAGLSHRPEVCVEYGEPAERIVQNAKQRGVDLIVLGVRDAAGRLGAATHLERATAHKVVAHAACPVLTVRS